MVANGGWWWGGIVYRRETKTYGEPTYVQKFTGVHQGWAVCGDYFVWIDTEGGFVRLLLLVSADFVGLTLVSSYYPTHF